MEKNRLNIENKIKTIKHRMNSKKDIQQTLVFQVRESPAPLNVPTPTPAPDRGGLSFVAKLIAVHHEYETAIDQQLKY